MGRYERERAPIYIALYPRPNHANVKRFSHHQLFMSAIAFWPPPLRPTLKSPPNFHSSWSLIIRVQLKK